MLVQRARDEFLARAALACDQHSDHALAQAADGAEHVLHRRRLAEHLRHLRLAVVTNLLAQALVDRAADQLHRLGHVEGLGQVLEGAALEGAHRAVQVGVGGHDDDRQAGVALLHRAEQVDAGAAGHADIAHQHLRLVAAVERRHHVARVREAADRVFLARQRPLQYEADRLVVVNDPDGFHALPVSIPPLTRASSLTAGESRF